MTALTFTPLIPEPLPLYSRDPETISIRSACPSYVSEAPTYHSRRPSLPSNQDIPVLDTPSTIGSVGTGANARRISSLIPPSSTQNTQRTSLPAPQFAPGFESRAHGSMSNLDLHNYSIGHWSNINSSHASRQYHAVARRRAASQACSMLSAMNGPSSSWSAYPVSFSSSSTSIAGSSTSSSAVVPASGSATSSADPHASGPLYPLEDPYLVGERAAARARAARIYRENCQRHDEVVRHESKAWDFMVGQMAETDRPWRRLKGETGRGKLLGRVLGLRK